MAHLLVDQLRFTRSEWQRGFAGISDDDARRRLPPMNCLSWMIGHLATHEQYCWIWLVEGKELVPGLNDLVGYGRPASTPPLAEMWDAWHAITRASDPFLDTLTPETLQTHLTIKGRTDPESLGTNLQRLTLHYWYHLGEALAVRQMLGHPDLPEYVGDLNSQAPYRPESATV
jgi:hypothetical protein